MRTFAIIAACLFASAASAQDWPKTSHDGLELQADTGGAVVYWRDGATLKGYSKIYLVEAAVAFQKNWQRDQNAKTVSASNRISSSDMEAIKRSLSDEFRAVFVDELQNKGGFEIVEEIGEDVLLIRPAIINLYINAPDVRNTGRDINMVTSAGEMTLYLEFYDAYTGSIIGRVLDRQVDQAADFAMGSNRVTNRRVAEGILRGWAQELREHMSELP